MAKEEWMNISINLAADPDMVQGIRRSAREKGRPVEEEAERFVKYIFGLGLKEHRRLVEQQSGRKEGNGKHNGA